MRFNPLTITRLPEPTTTTTTGEKKAKRALPDRVSRTDERAYPFLPLNYSGPAARHFIAASSLTTATMTRRAASTSEWKIRVFTDGSKRERESEREREEMEG